MVDYQYNFHRQEKKYLLTEEQCGQLLMKISEHIEPDSYGKYQICNLYFDTSTYDLIRHSISKPLYKEKFRVRSYGTPEKETMVYLELKKKYDGVVYKRRISLPYQEAIDYCVGGIKPKRNDQVFQEIDRFLMRYELYPMLYLSYERTAIKGIKERDLRITFDRNLLWRITELDLEKGVFGKEHLPENACIMEIKTDGGMPLWLCEALSNLKIYPQSFSKYGSIYQKDLAKHNLNDYNGGQTYVV